MIVSDAGAPLVAVRRDEQMFLYPIPVALSSVQGYVIWP
jgi:hypothetical protein